MSQMLTFILQAALPVRFDLHLAQVLAALVLQQGSLPLQLPERSLDLLPAAHLKSGRKSQTLWVEWSLICFVISWWKCPPLILTSLSNSLTSLSKRLVAFLEKKKRGQFDCRLLFCYHHRYIKERVTSTSNQKLKKLQPCRIGWHFLLCKAIKRISCVRPGADYRRFEMLADFQIRLHPSHKKNLNRRRPL